MSVNKEINKNLENIRKFVDRRTKLKAKEFRRKTLLSKRKDENLRRREKETILEAPKLVQSLPGRSALTNIAGRGKGFLERILKFISYLAAGWVFRNIPALIGYGKEFFARLNKAREILKNMVKAIEGTFKSLGKVYDAALTNLLKFDFNDTEKRLENAWKEVSDNVNEVGKQYDEGVKLLTTPLLDAEYRGSYSGEFVPPFVGEERTPPPAAEPTATTTTTTSQANQGTGRDGTFGQGTYGQGRPTDGTPAPTSTEPPPQSYSSGIPGSGLPIEWRALLNTLALAEGTINQPNDGYNTHFGYDQTQDLSAHPAIIKTVRSDRVYRSDAFGRYQFLSTTWARIGGAVKPHDGKPFKTGMDMSPRNQDEGAKILSEKVGVTLQRLKKEGFSREISNALAPEWASVPTISGASAYGQPVQKYERLKKFYDSQVKTLQTAKAQPLNSMMNIAKIDDKSLDNNNTLNFMRDSSTGNDSSLLADQSISTTTGLEDNLKFADQSIATTTGSNDNFKFKDNYLDFVKSNLNINFDALPKQLQETIKQERKRPKVIIARQAPSISPQVISSGTEETITIDTSSMVNTLIKKQNLTRLAYT